MTTATPSTETPEVSPETTDALETAIGAVVDAFEEDVFGTPDPVLVTAVVDAFRAFPDGNSGRSAVRSYFRDATDTTDATDRKRLAAILMADQTVTEATKGSHGSTAREAAPTLADVADARAVRLADAILGLDEALGHDRTTDSLTTALADAVRAAQVDNEDAWTSAADEDPATRVRFERGLEDVLKAPTARAGGGTSPDRDPSVFGSGTPVTYSYKGKDHAATIEHDPSTSTGVAIVTEDGVRHTSPSAAAAHLSGGSVNGWTAWTVDEDGRTINDHATE